VAVVAEADCAAPMNAFGLLKQCGRNGFPKTLQDIALVRLASTSSKIHQYYPLVRPFATLNFLFFSLDLSLLFPCVHELRVQSLRT